MKPTVDGFNSKFTSKISFDISSYCWVLTSDWGSNPFKNLLLDYIFIIYKHISKFTKDSIKLYRNMDY